MSASINEFPADDLPDQAVSTNSAYFALSKFKFDGAVAAIIKGETKGNYEVLERNALYTIPDDDHVHGSIKKYFYVGEGYVMGAVVNRDDYSENDIYSWLGGHQELVWSLAFGDTSGGIVFSNHAGNPKARDYGMHGEMLGDANCLCSSFVQSKNILLGLYHITCPEQPETVYFYLPRDAFEAVEYKDKQIIIRQGDITAVMDFSERYFTDVTGDFANKRIVVPAKNFCFSVRVFEGAFGNAGDARLQAEGGFARLTTAEAELEIAGNCRRVNGKEIDFNAYPLYQSPYLNKKWE
jgi:hypothetical protein